MSRFFLFILHPSSFLCAMLSGTKNNLPKSRRIRAGVNIMGQADRGVEIATGRRQADGHVRLAPFTQDLLALTVEGYAERAPTLLLTRAQARELQLALTRFIPLLTEQADEVRATETWAGRERRTTGELK